jgi:hypothetical protein
LKAEFLFIGCEQLRAAVPFDSRDRQDHDFPILIESPEAAKQASKAFEQLRIQRRLT